ncbi:MAG: T9SS type A sorting domain-containing protein [Bacteroidota bacterium]|nr:T9SS type A sorting domain-containing protein [Bacteroidota bacterium]
MRILYKVILSYFLFLFVLSSGNCQKLSPEVYSTMGGFSQGKNFQLSWTCGETFFQTINGNKYLLTQGFNQTSYLISYILSITSDMGSFIVYPNPATDIIYLKCNLKDLNELRYEVMDFKGITVLKGIILNSEEILNIKGLSGDFYIINVYRNNQLLNACKLVKLK